MKSLLKKKNAAWLSVASNTFLTIGKFIAGLLTGSVSILSEAAHSAIDLMASIIATFSVHMSDLPPDKNHQYGHEKIENISGVIEGVLIFAAAIWIIYESIDKLLHGVEIKHLGSGVLVMAISAGLNTVVASLLKKSSIENRSIALEADAAHLYTDVYTSLGVFIGLFIITIAQWIWGVSLAWLDPLIAIGVALLIFFTAFSITKKSFLPLMDSSASPEEMILINGIMDKFRGQDIDFHKLRTRQSGGTLHIDLHMGCKPGISLEQGHEISHRLKAEIEEAVTGAKVLVHVEPSNLIVALPEDDRYIVCMREELLKDQRVREIKNLKVLRYRNDLRIEAELVLDPGVTLAESRILTDDLTKNLTSCFPEVKETVLSLKPDKGWKEVIHEDDKDRIRMLIGEHQGAFASIHELEVISSGGIHRVRLALGVPPALPVSEAHSIALHIKADVKELFPEGADIDVHIEPCNENCKECSAICNVRVIK
jgi:cation diffusion facilitator family transporter